MEKLTVHDVMAIKKCGKTTVYRWIEKGLVNSVTADGAKLVLDDDKLKSVVAGNTGVKKANGVKPVKHKHVGINSKLEKIVEDMQRQIAELKTKLEKLEANPILTTAIQPTRNPTVLGFGLRFVNERWIAYKRVGNKLYNVYVGIDASQAESKIKAWLSERPEINAKMNL